MIIMKIINAYDSDYTVKIMIMIVAIQINSGSNEVTNEKDTIFF